MIKGTSDFVLTGLNISARSAGESLALLKDDGTVASAVTLSGGDDGLGQRIVASLASAVQPGSYRLRLVTRGYATPAAEPETYMKRVTVA